ncbi:hypothetical protein DFH08DRAFT_975333 [Mycena albidolilacea]|uniref:Uncharacterized protein n=1 Tax=Mycena albidolilacea TaxID=1033008 RepID=A0AAD6Z654_9AGAR|nr:hypothetical protein DFH08DRAFT_975333 [Mycena albidolilacea]
MPALLPLPQPLPASSPGGDGDGEYPYARPPALQTRGVQNSVFLRVKGLPLLNLDQAHITTQHAASPHQPATYALARAQRRSTAKSRSPASAHTYTPLPLPKEVPMASVLPEYILKDTVGEELDRPQIQPLMEAIICQTVG